MSSESHYGPDDFGGEDYPSMEDHGRETGIGLSMKQQEQKRYNTDPKMSAQPCGCDPGANHKCENCTSRQFMAADAPYVGIERQKHNPFGSKQADKIIKDVYGNNDPVIGIGGAPTRASTLPTAGPERKKYPVASGVLDYFPDALVAIANISYTGNQQHHKDKPLHWDRSKSGDEADTMVRHFLQRGTLDTDGVRHSAKLAWRALALLQKEIEASQ